MSMEDNKALMHRFLEEVFNKKNLAAVDECIAPNQVDHTLPAFLPPTREGTRRAIGLYLKAFPDLHLVVEDMIAEGDKVVTGFTSHGTPKRTLVGIPLTGKGKQVTISSIVIVRIADGKIVEQWGVMIPTRGVNMFESKRLQGAYLIGAVIVWSGIFLASALLFSGTAYFAQFLPLFGGAAVYFILLVPGGYVWEHQKPKQLLPAGEKTLFS